MTFNEVIFGLIIVLAFFGFGFVCFTIFDFFYEVPRALKKILKILEERDKDE